jgi:hypothetical protein
MLRRSMKELAMITASEIWILAVRTDAREWPRHDAVGLQVRLRRPRTLG